MKGPIIHKNLYATNIHRDEFGTRYTVCDERVNFSHTTDDWDKVRCKKCQARRPDEKA